VIPESINAATGLEVWMQESHEETRAHRRGPPGLPEPSLETIRCPFGNLERQQLAAGEGRETLVEGHEVVPHLGGRRERQVEASSTLEVAGHVTPEGCPQSIALGAALLLRGDPLQGFVRSG
jgi:hypothetical protein